MSWTQSRSSFHRLQVRFFYCLEENRWNVIWSLMQGPRFNPWFWQWWTANHYGMVTVGRCVRKVQVLHKTESQGGGHEYDLPLLLSLVQTDRGLVLLQPNIWPLSVHRSRKKILDDIGRGWKNKTDEIAGSSKERKVTTSIYKWWCNFPSWPKKYWKVHKYLLVKKNTDQIIQQYRTVKKKKKP